MVHIEKYFGNKLELNQTDLEKFRDQGVEESANIDYKRYQTVLNNTEEIAKDIVAFANASGGILFLGFSEKKRGKHRIPDEIDWGESNITAETLENRMHSRIKPTLDFVIKQVWNNDKTKHIYLIETPQGKNAPYWCKQGFYRRRDRTSELMDYDEIKNMFYLREIKREKINEVIFTPILNVLFSYVKNAKHQTGLLRHDVKLNEGQIRSIIHTHGYYYNTINYKIQDIIDQLIDFSSKRSRIIGTLSNDLRKLMADSIKASYNVEVAPPQYLEIEIVSTDFVGRKQNTSINASMALLYNKTPQDYYLVQKDDLVSVKVVNYKINIINKQPTQRGYDSNTSISLTESEFMDLWDELLKKVGRSPSIQYLIASTRKLYQDCIDLIDTLEEVI